MQTSVSRSTAQAGTARMRARCLARGRPPHPPHRSLPTCTSRPAARRWCPAQQLLDRHDHGDHRHPSARLRRTAAGEDAGRADRARDPGGRVELDRRGCGRSASATSSASACSCAASARSPPPTRAFWLYKVNHVAPEVGGEQFALEEGCRRALVLPGHRRQPQHGRRAGDHGSGAGARRAVPSP